MHDPVRHTAQRYDSAGLKWCSLRQTAETRSDPTTVKLRKVLGFHQSAARRHGQDRFAIGWMNAQRVSARAAMPAQSNCEELRAVFDDESRGFGGPPIEEGASSHVLESGEQEFARILPYPPPRESHLNRPAQKQIICPIYRG
jgi:hypothetical protein